LKTILLPKWLKFSFILLVSETILVISLIIGYLLIEQHICPGEFYASGHCYANWFYWFDWIFYAIALVLIYSTLWILVIYLYLPVPRNKIKELSWCLTITLVVFMFVSDFRYIGQVVITMAYIQIIKMYSLAKYSTSKA
jgi:hypothetical protein